MTDFVESTMEILVAMRECRARIDDLQDRVNEMNQKWTRAMHDLDQAEIHYKDLLVEFEREIGYAAGQKQI